MLFEKHDTGSDTCPEQLNYVGRHRENLRMGSSWIGTRDDNVSSGLFGRGY